MLDAEDWEIVFKVYAEQPKLAFILAQHLTHLKESLQRGPEGALEAIAEIDLGIESLYPHTDFQKAGHKLFSLAVAGTITTEQEKMIDGLGVSL